MSQTKSHGLFIELSDHSIVAARTAIRDARLVVEEMHEHALAAKAPADAALSAVVTAAGAAAANSVCVFRPDRRFFHLASREEAGRCATAAAVREFATGPAFAEFGACDIASVAARSGGAVGSDGTNPWMLAGVPREKSAAAMATLREWQLGAARFESATLSLLGASQQLLRASSNTGPLLVWEIGESFSDLFVVSADGVEAARRVGFGFDKIIESLLAEISLKFKASAAKLFFNELYDFSEAGPKIAARVASALSADVTALGARRAPALFLGAGLPAKQAWFNQNLAVALNLAEWKPDLVAWSAKAGFDFSSAVSETGVSPSWLGVLGSISAAASGKSAGSAPWHPIWFGNVPAAAESPVVAEKPAPAPATPIPAAAKKPQAPAVVVSPPAAAKAQPATPVARAASNVAPATPAVTPTPASAAAKPAVAETTSAKAARSDANNGNNAKDRRDAQQGKSSRAVSNPAKAEKTPAASTTGAAVVPSAAKPVSAPAAAAAPSSATVAEFPRAPRKPSFLQNRAALALVALVVVVIGLGVFYFQRTSAQQAAALREKERLAKQLADNAEARRIAEQKAEEETEARRRAEEAAAKTASMAQAEHQRAEEEARRREIETKRLLNARGALKIVTEPAGATIEIGNLSPRISPATITDLRLGKYTAVVSLPGFDPVTVDLEVKENETTNPGPIVLARQFGKLTVTTDPAGVNFEVRPATARVGVGSSDAHLGTTPATLDDLPTGDYVITLFRDGWPNHTETVSVQKGVAAKVARNYAGGSINVSSRPQGASVFMNGNNVGVTPLVIPDVPPGDVAVTLELPGHVPAKVVGNVSADKPLDLSVVLEAVDRLAGLSELDERPVPLKTVNPAIATESFPERQSVIVSVVVDTDGVPRDMQVVQSTNDELANRCLEAVTQWRFKPAMIRGKPVKTRVSIPFVVK